MSEPLPLEELIKLERAAWTALKDAQEHESAALRAWCRAADRVADAQAVELAETLKNLPTTINPSKPICQSH